MTDTCQVSEIRPDVQHDTEVQPGQDDWDEATRARVVCGDLQPCSVTARCEVSVLTGRNGERLIVPLSSGGVHGVLVGMRAGADETQDISYLRDLYCEQVQELRVVLEAFGLVFPGAQQLRADLGGA